MTWCQFNPQYNEHAQALWDRTRKWDFDTSHEISDVDADGVRRKIATFRHADDAGLVEQLVNAFRDGKLMIKDDDDENPMCDDCNTRIGREGCKCPATA